MITNSHSKALFRQRLNFFEKGYVQPFESVAENFRDPSSFVLNISDPHCATPGTIGDSLEAEERSSSPRSSKHKSKSSSSHHKRRKSSNRKTKKSNTDSKLAIAVSAAPVTESDSMSKFTKHLAALYDIAAEKEKLLDSQSKTLAQVESLRQDLHQTTTENSQLKDTIAELTRELEIEKKKHARTKDSLQKYKKQKLTYKRNFHSTHNDLEKLTEQHRASSTELASLKPLFSEITSALECIVCLENTSNTVLFPCAHCIMCFGCANKVNVCPLCNYIIDERKKIFLNWGNIIA